jgi:hypothetical protein
MPLSPLGFLPKSARVTADALDRTNEAKALREKYGLTEAVKPEAC